VRVRSGVAAAARVATVALVGASALRLVPHLLLAEAAVTSAVTMVLAPLSLLDQPHGGWLRIPGFLRRPFPAVTLLSIGDIAILLPPVVALLDGGGAGSAAVLALLYGGALTFWAVVMPPARVTGIGAAGYVCAGSVPISMPALLLILAPRDLYPAFHAAGTMGIGGQPDQQVAGFIVFGMVKVVIFIAFSVIFMAAAASEERDHGEGGGDDGGSRVRRPAPGLPGWALDLGPASPSVPEPEPEPRRERVLSPAGR